MKSASRLSFALERSMKIRCGVFSSKGKGLRGPETIDENPLRRLFIEGERSARA